MKRDEAEIFFQSRLQIKRPRRLNKVCIEKLFDSLYTNEV